MSTDIVKRNFLGIPVEGEINVGEKREKQRPLSELEPLIRAVLDDPTIDSFGWTQYTPYFNDGEPCTFRVGEPWFKTVDDAKRAEDEGTDNYEFTMSYSGHPSLGKRDYDYVGDWPDRKRVDRGYTGADEARFGRCAALGEAIEGGEFEDVLLEAFGDHARIEVRRSGISVEFYSHD